MLTLASIEMECCSACWGAPFSSGACPPHFVFKNKFFDSCRNCILVRLRASRLEISSNICY